MKNLNSDYLEILFQELDDHLVLQGIVNRETEDVDVLRPYIMDLLKRHVVEVAGEHGLADNWMNDAARGYATRCLTSGWEERCFKLFTGKRLTVKTISRIDQICMKTIAAKNRPRDVGDLMALSPSKSEIEEVIELLLQTEEAEGVYDFEQKIRKFFNSLGLR